MAGNMESWTSLDVLVSDYRNALVEADNEFSKRILALLKTGPGVLVNEYINHPSARLVASNGDWLSLWAGGVYMDGELYEHKAVIGRIEELLEKQSN